MQQHPSLLKGNTDDSFNIRELVDRYLIYWKWFVLGVITCFACAFLYLRYAIPQYKASATILVKDERKGGLQSESTAFADLGLMTGIKNNVDNEIEVIKSRTIIEKAIKKLNFNVVCFTKGRVKSMEVYDDNPVSISFFDTSESFYKKDRAFEVKSVSDKKFEILTVNDKSLGQFSYGNVINLGYCKMIVTNVRSRDKDLNDYALTVYINKLSNIVQSYKSRIAIAPLSKNSSVVELTLTDPIKQKAEDLLDMIIEIYNQDAIDEKNFISRKTEEFIAGRLIDRKSVV